jgi:hypothetical protein
MRDAVAHTEMAAAKLNGLFLSLSPSPVVLPRDASDTGPESPYASCEWLSPFCCRNGSENEMSSHGLLLRLFLSQGFFSVLRALQYIRTYSDNIGITHYLCSRLDAVPTDELADKWPLIWCVDASLFCSTFLISTGSHLLVISPSTKSSALESFVLGKAQQSTHLALMVRSPTSMA